ncbi:hypothetical protein [Streptomyces rubiginosohelvolus]|uniref:hypothetical protein n=1 Tax=Streptomyces rubiginosohelvolus TaxID=67362 RepID=UPI0036C47D25
MDAEIMQWVDQAGPYVAAAVGAYGTAVLTRAEGTAVDGTVALGRRILQALWRRQNASGRTELEQAVADAADRPDDADATAGLRHQLERALREDVELRGELATLLGAAMPGVRTGDHSPSVSHSDIGGDNIQIGQAGGAVRIGRT